MIELDGRRVARTTGRLVRRLVRAGLWLAAAALPALVVATLYEAAAAQRPRAEPEFFVELNDHGGHYGVVSCDCGLPEPWTAADARALALDLMAQNPAPPPRLPVPRPLSGPITDAEINEAISGASAGW